MEVDGRRHTPAAFPPGKRSGTHCTGGLVGPNRMFKPKLYLQHVAGSIPAGVTGFFIDKNPSDRTMALGSTQPLAQMSTRSISWG